MYVLELSVDSDNLHDGGARARFYPIGDPHLDLKVADCRRLRKYVEFIAQDPHGFALCVGDIFNASLPGHKYFSSKALKGDIVGHTDDYANVALEKAERLFAPLRDAGRPAVFMRGNHDRWLKGMDIVKLLVDRLGPTVRYGGSEALVRVKVGRGSTGANVWTVYAAHGAGGGYTPGGKVTRYAATVPHIADVDIFVRGHVHDAAIRILPRHSVTHTGALHLRTRPVAYVTTNSFNNVRVENVVDYAGEQSLPPVDSGVLYLELTNPRNKGEGDQRTHSGRLRRYEWDG